jgi:hypothetical protein
MFIPLKMVLIGINPHPHWISADPNGRPSVCPLLQQQIHHRRMAFLRRQVQRRGTEPGKTGENRGPRGPEPRGNPGNIQKDVENPWVSGGSSSILEKKQGNFC